MGNHKERLTRIHALCAELDAALETSQSLRRRVLCDGARRPDGRDLRGCWPFREQPPGEPIPAPESIEPHGHNRAA